MAGAKLLTFMPINMLLDGMGLSITGFSYNGVLWVCVVADRSVMPDPAFFAECFKDSFAELVAAAGTQPRPQIAEPAPPGKRAKSSLATKTGRPSGRAGKAPTGKAPKGKKTTGKKTTKDTNAAK
jgi:hypothetical protein